MKINKLILTLLLVLNFTLTQAQKKEKQIVTSVEFTADKIILNKKHAFNYTRNDNHFEIIDLNGKVVIEGNIKPLGDGKFSSQINFTDLNQYFYNEKIIGRNDLIFALCENNVITKKFELDIEKLRLFIKKYNQLGGSPPVAD